MRYFSQCHAITRPRLNSAINLLPPPIIRRQGTKYLNHWAVNCGVDPVVFEGDEALGLMVHRGM